MLGRSTLVVGCCRNHQKSILIRFQKCTSCVALNSESALRVSDKNGNAMRIYLSLKDILLDDGSP